MEEKKKVLCITRKYPPQVGGMENFCFNVFSRLAKEERYDTKIVSLGKKQSHLIWFFPYTVFYTIFNAHKYDAFIIGDGLLCFLGVLSKIFAPKTKRITIIYGLDFLYSNPIYQAYLRLWLKKGSDVYVCISHGTMEAFEKWGIKTDTLITPGIDTDKCVSYGSKTADLELTARNKKGFYNKYNVPKDNLVCITVGRLVKRKGVEWFISNVMSRLSDYPITYMVIGGGEERENIEKAVLENKLEDKVKLLGRVSDDDLKECYDNADVFIMPNIHVENDMEGFGIVAVEASLRGLIVLASGIEGITDAIIDNKNGYVMESRNADEYIDKIKDIYKNRSEYDKKRLEFSEYTRNNFSWDAIGEKYKQLIDTVCKK